ncbi:hypothetical protein ACQY0O_005320 [Thecaphora frezii]
MPTSPASVSAPSPSSTATATPHNPKSHQPHPTNPPSAKRIKTEHAPSHPSTPRPAASTPTEPNPPASSLKTASSASNTATSKANASNASAAATTAAAAGGGGGGGGGGGDSGENFDSLVDIMGASGVDLRAEEEAIQHRDLLDHSSHNAAEAQEDQDGELYLQVYPLAFKVHTIAQKHGLGVDAAVLNYLSLAARTRFRNIIESAIASSRHRSWSSHQHPPPMFDDGGEARPMYHETILSDPRKQLAALEKAERGDEARRRKERLARDEEAAALSSGAGGESEGGEGGDGGGGDLARGGVGPDGKRKPKKMGPGVAARNLSEDVQKRLANSTALRNLGGGASKYSWLQGGGAFGGGGGGAAFGGLQNKAKAKAETGTGGEGESDGSGTASRLPKPKFAPQPSVVWKTGKVGDLGGGAGGDEGSGGKGGEDKGTAATAGAGAATGAGMGGSTGANSSTTSWMGAWGDVSARQAAKEEEERRERLKVTLRDALFALEYERSGASGYGSGEAILYRARARAHKAS